MGARRNRRRNGAPRLCGGYEEQHHPGGHGGVARKFGFEWLEWFQWLDWLDWLKRCSWLECKWRDKCCHTTDAHHCPCRGGHDCYHRSGTALALSLSPAPTSSSGVLDCPT